MRRVQEGSIQSVWLALACVATFAAPALADVGGGKPSLAGELVDVGAGKPGPGFTDVGGGKPSLAD